MPRSLRQCNATSRWLSMLVAIMAVLAWSFELTPLNLDVPSCIVPTSPHIFADSRAIVVSGRHDDCGHSPCFVNFLANSPLPSAQPLSSDLHYRSHPPPTEISVSFHFLQTTWTTPLTRTNASTRAVVSRVSSATRHRHTPLFLNHQHPAAVVPHLIPSSVTTHAGTPTGLAAPTSPVVHSRSHWSRSFVRSRSLGAQYYARGGVGTDGRVRSWRDIGFQVRRRRLYPLVLCSSLHLHFARSQRCS